MKSDNQNSIFVIQTEKFIDPKEFLFKYILRYWYIYFLCIIIATVGSRLYLRYTIPLYQAKCTLLIKNDSQNSGLSEEKLLGSLGIINQDKNMENEIQILKSRTLMREVVDELRLNIRYFTHGRVQQNEIYGNCPIRLDSFITNNLPANGYNIIAEKEPNFTFAMDSISEIHQYGVPFSNQFGTFLINRDTTVFLAEKTEINVKVENVENTAHGLSSSLLVAQVGKYSNVLTMSLITPQKKKGEHILDKLIEVYNRAAINDKTRVSANTLQFIEDRLLFLTTELSEVELGLEKFKKTNDIPLNVTETAGLLSSELNIYDKELARLDIQLNILGSVKDYLESRAQNFDYVPANIGINNPAVTNLLEKFNDLLINRDRFLRSGTPDNPTVSSIEAQLRNLRENIIAAIRDEVNNLQLTRNQISQKNQLITNRTRTVPRIERQFLEIYRQQNIKQSLYLFLLQKREETALSMAVTAANARVIDSAKAGGQVEPKPQMIYAVGLLLGLGIPILLIVLMDLLNDKIQSQQDIDKETKSPILGGISYNSSKKLIVVSKGSRSSIAEMFRLLRTNLQFMAAEKGNKVVMVTSSSSGEGKTFITVNLGLSLALSGKRTVLLGLDLRKPKLKKYLTDEPENTGITNYLIGDMSIEEITNQSNLDPNLYYLPSGPVPPNPAELMMGSRMEKLIDHLKENFDTVLIDTPPVGLVADALLLDKFVDSTYL
ncbi:MAG: polysaccharide biosynthesis tyrosine autokinase [Saprospiraceae bacterium]|nr:polysaccharide biosynthesis tyrosine autokinase [Saprospiraceae bacterium]